MEHSENTRVKIPLLVHFTRLGYKYVSLKEEKDNIDTEINVFRNIFCESISRINKKSYTSSNIEKIINELKILLNNEDLGKSFYKVLFKTDFSEYRDELADDKLRERFFAGVPKIPNKDKEKMSIYLMFIQHIIYSLNKKGKAAIVVPTVFLTAGLGIEKTIRERLVEGEIIKGVISMPSNIFATTGTNVSILFIDKCNKGGKVLLVDASKLGNKVKEGKNQRTVLKEEEIEKIINTFEKREKIDEFSIEVNYDEIKEKNYSSSAGQYFEIKNELVELAQQEFEEKMREFTNNLEKYFSKSKFLENEIKRNLEELKYEM